ncbi:hypothetical protein RP726_05770 [Candidatus Methylospira mobilis]|uniref:hypothetical protein n=1 Tax=Candidatus Methylospira mobilis TaxID=1808979 RepID=UPI0028E8C85C|nr:hypothetical protein [Candidatus Methylospira mobilis]WNV05920.1 hypothetical protein RP726_05770 [Candidatus Methylospira mobilis]
MNINQSELEQKLRDATQPGTIVTLTLEEAAQAGLYPEDAMSEEDALESSLREANEEGDGNGETI